MSSRPRGTSAFLKDAIVATAVVAVVLAPTAFAVGPNVLRAPGYVLYVPLLFLYVVTGGELEGSNEPSVLFLAAYVLGVGLLAAGVAHLVREYCGVTGPAAIRFVVTGVPAVAGTLAVLVGVGTFGGLLDLGTTMAAAAFVGGLALVAIGLVLARE